MGTEISGEVGIAQVATGKGKYKKEYELPHSMKTCEGKLILVKQKGIINKEKWYMKVHQDSNGSTKSTALCLDSGVVE